MKKLIIIAVLILPTIALASELQVAVKNITKVMASTDPVVECKEEATGDVENSEVKMMYPCSIWKDKKAILDDITDKKKVYKAANGQILSKAEVDALTPDEKKAAEKKEMMEKSDIIFSKLQTTGNGNSNVVIRTRTNNTTGEKDYTIKLRPMEPNDLKTTGLNKKLIKCERDVSSVEDDGSLRSQSSLIADRKTISCSQTIDDVTTSTAESKKFLSVNGISVRSAVPYAAIKSEKRSIKATDLGFAADYMGVDSEGKEIKLKISLEKWQVPGKTYPEGCFLELSAKSPVPKMSQIGADLKKKFESKLGVSFDPSVVQGNKTGQALKLMEN